MLSVVQGRMAESRKESLERWHVEVNGVSGSGLDWSYREMVLNVIPQGWDFNRLTS
mgnify:CR=1 FL=1